MPTGSFFALLDDIATILDDVAAMTKVAAKKTSGVLGDDLALNANQVSGVNADRELPVVWAVAKGSAINKVILVPLALLISFFAPGLVTPLLIVGGVYLCFEGCEKIFHKFFHAKAEKTEPVQKPQSEAEKIKGAIRTDFILSAEIITISLGTVANSPLNVQIPVLVGISILMTVGVYGLVAGIVKLDDLGIYLVTSAKGNSIKVKIGTGILLTAPYLMKALSIGGTIAMFLVGGGIIVHGWPWLHHWIEALAMGSLVNVLCEGLVGFVAGSVAVAALTLSTKLFRSKKNQ